MKPDLEILRRRLRRFARERDWEQFHTPKNLAMALSVEVAELVEHFQWLSPDESADPPQDRRREIALEMADILIYLIRMADRLDVDLTEAVMEKMDINADRFPVEQVRGRAYPPDKDKPR